MDFNIPTIMKHLYKFGLLCLTLFLLLFNSCKKEPKTATANNNKPSATMLVMPNKGGIPKEQVEVIINRCSHIDFNFTDLSFSMNQSEKNAVIADMSYISPESVDAIPNTCRPMARKVYYGHGKVLLEADIYFSQECLYFVFIKDEKPMYANRINQTGVTFYTNVLNQALGMQNK
jgi:hypothetical protein